MFHDSLPRFGAAALAAALSLSAFSAELQFSAFDIGAVQIGGSGSGVDSAELTSLQRELQAAIDGEATSRATNDSALSAALAEEIGSREDGDTWLYGQMRRRAEYGVYEEEVVVTTNATSGVAETNITFKLTGDYLAKESDVDAVSSNLADHVSATNNPHKVTAKQLGALTAETDPDFAAWKDGCFPVVIGKDAQIDADPYSPSNLCVVVGSNALVTVALSGSGAGGTAIGANAISDFSAVSVGASASSANGSVAIGPKTEAYHNQSIAIGHQAKATEPEAIAIGNMANSSNQFAITIGSVHTSAAVSQGDGTFNISTADPAHFWFGAAGYDADATPIKPRNLQSYLDEHVAWGSLTNEVNALARALVKAKLDALDPDSATPADIVVALQSLYTNLFTVTYVDGTGNGSAVRRVRAGAHAANVVPEAPGDIFLGWFEEGAANAFDFGGTAVTNDLTLTAAWTPAVARVTIGGRTTLHATLNDAARVACGTAGVTSASITMLRKYDNPASEWSWEITGRGHDKSYVTITNDYALDFTDMVDSDAWVDGIQSTARRSIAINGATVTFCGSGSYMRNAGTHSMVCVGEGVDSGAITDEADAYAVVTVDGCVFAHNNASQAAHVFNVQNGSLTFNGGRVLNQYNGSSSKYCVRAEPSEVGAATQAGSVVVNGGTFDIWGSRQPILAKSGASVSLTGLYDTGFYAPSKANVTAMTSYLAAGLSFAARTDDDGKVRYHVVTSE